MLLARLFRRAKKNRNIFDVPAVLNDFYALAYKLSELQHLQFKEKDDNGDSILWRFNYKGRKYTLSFNIYNGLSIYTSRKLKNKSSKKAEDELAGVLSEM